MFKPKINKDSDIFEDMSVHEEFIPAGTQRDDGLGITVYERMQLDIASRKLYNSRKKYAESLKRTQKVRCVSPVIELHDSPEKHTKTQLDARFKKIAGMLPPESVK